MNWDLVFCLDDLNTWAGIQRYLFGHPPGVIYNVNIKHSRCPKGFMNPYKGPYTLRNDLENIFQPTSSKISLKLTSGLKHLFWDLRLKINSVYKLYSMIHFCRYRRRKKFLENFRKFISQERHIRILISSTYCLYFNLLFELQLDSLSKYDFYENRSFEFLWINYESFHLCSSVKFRWWNLFIKSLETSLFLYYGYIILNLKSRQRSG